APPAPPSSPYTTLFRSVPRRRGCARRPSRRPDRGRPNARPSGTLTGVARGKTIVGAHVGRERPLEAAATLGADCVQIFLSDPQSWRKPPARDDASELASSGVPVYVHAPYLINVCSPRNNVRYGSRKILQQTCEAAA